MDIYTINTNYINYLKKTNPQVQDNEKENGNIRPYVGILFSINTFNYFVPLSSPKDSDYLLINNEKVIRKSIVPIHRIIIKSISEKDGQAIEEINFLGKLLFSKMIPVPSSELELINIDSWPNEKHKNIFINQLRYLRKNEIKLKKQHAALIYKQKTTNQNIKYLEFTLDFKLLEIMSLEYNTPLVNKEIDELTAITK